MFSTSFDVSYEVICSKNGDLFFLDLGELGDEVPIFFLPLFLTSTSMSIHSYLVLLHFLFLEVSFDLNKVYRGFRGIFADFSPHFFSFFFLLSALLLLLYNLLIIFSLCVLSFQLIFYSLLVTFLYLLSYPPYFKYRIFRLTYS